MTTTEDTGNTHQNNIGKLSPPASPTKKDFVSDLIDGKKANSAATETELTASRASRNNNDATDDRNNVLEVEFVPPTEGTPAALALAGTFVYILL